MVKELPIRQLLVETDSPFLNPSGEINSPLNIPEIYEEIAKIKGYDKKEIENNGYDIVLNMGDQYSDLKGGYAERVFKLPNPFYYVK